MKVAAVIQCTPWDLYQSLDPDDYSVSALQAFDLVDEVVLAVPKIGDYKVFDEIARKWGVGVYYGSEYNVAERLHNAVARFSPAVVLRVILRRFYMDFDLVGDMVRKLVDGGYDYVNLGRDVNYEVAADVISYKALGRAVELLRTLPDDFRSNSLRFNPWVFMETREEFRVHTMDYRQMWDGARVRAVKEKLGALMNADENMQPVAAENPASRYAFVNRFIDEGDVVLDIACGQGGGVGAMGEKAGVVYGIDYNRGYVERARKEYGNGKLNFLFGTDELLTGLDVTFDKAVSLHTLEHVEDDRLFLERVRGRLKDGGKLILEVPRLFQYPLGEPLLPMHRREYTREALEELLRSTGFEIEVSFGGNRGSYVDIDSAREVLFYVCAKA